MRHFYANAIFQGVTVLLFGFSIGYFGQGFVPVAVGMQSCHTITDASVPLKDGYGSPINFFSGRNEVFVQTLCDENDVHVRIGTGEENFYIYERAYERVDGEWKKIALEGAEKVGPWFIGSANATIERSDKELQEENRIITYTCQKVDGRWKCGCRNKECDTAYWQIQEFTEPSQFTTPDNDVLYAASLYPYEGSVGTEVAVVGNGFSSTGNTVYFDANSLVGDPTDLHDDLFDFVPTKDMARVQNLSSENGASIAFTVPSELTTGGYRIWVENAEGEFAMGSEFRVTRASAPRPTVTSITPNTGNYGTEITIHGSGFTAEGNDVSVTYGTIRNLPSSDGTTIRLSIEPFSDFLSYQTVMSEMADSGLTIPLVVYVANEGGLSEEKQEFVLTFE